MFDKKKLILFAFLIILPSTMFILYNVAKANVNEVKIGNVGLRIVEDYKNDPLKAAQDGIKGYIDVQISNLDKTISRDATENNAFDLTLTFVSYDPEIKSTTVRLDPQNTPHKKYQMVKGEITCVINDYLSYSEKEITLEAGKQSTLKMYVNIPNGAILTKMYVSPSLGMIVDYPITGRATVIIDD
jgi:Sec-independent protein secretion pathway component TatC